MKNSNMKMSNMKMSIQSSKGTLDNVDLRKRQHLKWAPPIVIGVLLPTHAQATHRGPCDAKPVANGAPPTCKDLQVLEGNGTMTILSDGEDLLIQSISHDAPGLGGDTITLPSVPATVTSSSGINVVWKGPALDAVDCLPINNITITVSYLCADDDHEGPAVATFSLTAVFGG